MLTSSYGPWGYPSRNTNLMVYHGLNVFIRDLIETLQKDRKVNFHQNSDQLLDSFSRFYLFWVAANSLNSVAALKGLLR